MVSSRDDPYKVAHARTNHRTPMACALPRLFGFRGKSCVVLTALARASGKDVMMQPACRARSIAVAAALALVQMPALAFGFTVDARRLGMGGVVIPGCQELLALNVAYHSVPARPGVIGVVVPIPLGVVQLAQDPPSFDPDAPDFSVTRLANLALNPPFYLELAHPSDLDGDISI